MIFGIFLGKFTILHLRSFKGEHKKKKPKKLDKVVLLFNYAATHLAVCMISRLVIV
jgi:hypothetical protein